MYSQCAGTLGSNSRYQTREKGSGSNPGIKAEPDPIDNLINTIQVAGCPFKSDMVQEMDIVWRERIPAPSGKFTPFDDGDIPWRHSINGSTSSQIRKC